MKCPTCGCDAVEDAVYCSDCGAILRPDVPEIQGTFVCIVIAFTRTAHDDSRTASDMKVQDEIDRALAQSAEIAGRASLANTRLSDDEIAILYPFNIDYRENIDEAISSVVTLRDELALFIAESEVIALGIGIEIGEITYRDFILTSATGKDSPVNNALRLVRKATPNAILVSDNTAGLIEDYYQLKPVGFYRLYGGEDALKIYELIAPTPETTTPPPPPQSDTPDISNALQSANDFMTSIVSEKSSGFLSVTGDGRSGNTRFIEKLLVSLSDDEWFVARLVADEKTALEPFFLLRQLINLLSRDITDVIESDERGPQAVEFLKNALGLSAVIPFPESSRYAPSGGIIKEVLTKAIEKRNEKQPLLVVADDFHRADSASVKYLEKIVAKLVGVPLAVVVIHDGSYTTSPAPKEKITLPVLEDVATDDSALERYDILGETAKTIVKLLDVIRMPISSREISRILDINDIEEIETLLHGLGTAGLADKLITSGDVKYRVNESLDIEALSPDEPNNEEIYRRALTVLEEKGCTYDTVKASIAIVLDDYEKAVEYLIAAARRASVYGIHYETINILTYALGVAEDNRISDSQLAELYRMRGDIYVREGVVSASALDYEAASKLCAPDSGSHIDIELRKCRLLSDSGSIDETLDILNGINIEAIPQKIKVSRDIEEAYGDVYRSSNKPGTAESHYGRALELAEEKDVLYRLLTKLGQIKSAIGDTNGAIELLEKAYYLGQEIDDYILTAEAALKLSKILPYRLDVERSIYLAQQALRRYLDIYDYKNAADSYSSLANTALLAGDIDDFSENVERGKNTLAKHPKNNILVRFYLLQARFKLIIGDEDGFNEVIKHRSLKLRCLEDPETAIAVYLLKSEFATQITRDFENALRYVQKAMLILDKHAVLRLTRHAGITYAGVQRELGKPIEALRTLSNPELRDYINNNQLLQLDYYRVLGLALADTGKKEEGVSKLKLAAALSKDNRVKYSEGRAYIEMAPILGDDEAIDVVNRAVWLFDSMDSLFWRKRAEGVLSRPGKAGI